jgi:hypothetical protein
MNSSRLLPSVALQIALVRAKCVARRCFKRAVELLLNAGLAFEQAARYVAAHMRAAGAAA